METDSSSTAAVLQGIRSEAATENPQYTAEILSFTGIEKTDHANAETAARMQMTILQELEDKYSRDTREPDSSRTAADAAPLAEEELAEVTAEIAEDIAAGTVDYILLRDQKGQVVGYANTEVMPLSTEEADRAEKQKATLYIWLIGVRKDLRGSEAVKVLNEKILEAAAEQAEKRNITIVSVFMEGNRDMEKKFRKHWGTHGVYMEHPESQSLVEAPYIPPPAASTGGIIGDEFEDPHYKWLIGMLDESKTVSLDQFLTHADLVFTGYNEGQEEAYQAVVEDIRHFVHDAMAEILQGKPLRFMDHQDRARMREEANAQQIIDAQGFGAWLAQHFPALHRKFQALIENLRSFDQE
ncbi:MAG: hypothetical protein V1926_02985 [Candidatus Peregrinibacteria bacterium]